MVGYPDMPFFECRNSVVKPSLAPLQEAEPMTVLATLRCESSSSALSVHPRLAESKTTDNGKNRSAQVPYRRRKQREERRGRIHFFIIAPFGVSLAPENRAANSSPHSDIGPE